MFSHFYWARVTDNVDPDGLQRVKVAKNGEDDGISGWVPVLTPYGGNDVGLSFLPDVDDQVLVVSLGEGSIRNAVIGSAWTNEVSPPKTGENSSADLNSDGENSLKFFKSKSGNQIIFDDTEGAEKIQFISTGGKSRFEFNVAEELLSISTEHDLSIGAKGAISIQAEEISINSKKQTDISTDEYQVDAKKGLNINTDKDLTIKGSGVSLN